MKAVASRKRFHHAAVNSTADKQMTRAKLKQQMQSNNEWTYFL